uniref:Uncharacterized protein n=4 Tax=Triticinae TaxID=1648030 RepID=A0A453FRM2_AEGTS
YALPLTFYHRTRRAIQKREASAAAALDRSRHAAASFPSPFPTCVRAATQTNRVQIRRPISPARLPMAAGALVLALVAALAVALAGANSEGDALSALRRSLRDPGGVLQSWDPTLVNPCTWFHVTCDRDNRVTRLDLGNLNLSGHLVPELGKLEHLQYLELYKNNIEGTIPSELGDLKNLISLDLYKNNVSGTIPPTLGKLKSLVFLRLNGNRLTGPIPRELAGISSLKVVDVSGNNLCGTIPTTGPFEHIPLSNFERNPRLEGPELQGLAVYETNC